MLAERIDSAYGMALLEGQAATTDAVLLACTTVSLALIVGAMYSAPHWSTALILGGVLGAGLLTKGPVALVVPVAIALVACGLARREVAAEACRAPWQNTGADGGAGPAAA